MTTIDHRFGQKLEAEIPKLRRYARALTRDLPEADDLVQSCLTRALSKQHLWQPGTHLRAWLFTILHNQYVNNVRKTVREGIAVSIEDVSSMRAKDRTDGSMELRDLERVIKLLPQEQRQVILLIGLEGMRYEEVAEIIGVPVGTVRSRLSRGRELLRYLLDGGTNPTLDKAHEHQLRVAPERARPMRARRGRI